MREMMKHTAGIIFIAVLILSWVFAHVVAPGFFGSKTVVLGWMTGPIFIGIGLMIIWLIAFVIYLYRFWTYR